MECAADQWLAPESNLPYREQMGRFFLDKLDSRKVACDGDADHPYRENLTFSGQSDCRNVCTAAISSGVNCVNRALAVGRHDFELPVTHADALCMSRVNCSSEYPFATASAGALIGATPCKSCPWHSLQSFIVR